MPSLADIANDLALTPTPILTHAEIEEAQREIEGKPNPSAAELSLYDELSNLRTFGRAY